MTARAMWGTISRMRYAPLAHLTLTLSLLGCASDADADRAPDLDCSNGNCDTDSRVVTSDSNGGTSGTGGAASAGAAGEVTLSGRVVAIGEPNFTIGEGVAATGSYTVKVPGADNQPLSSTESSSFTVKGVRYSKSLWLSATPTTATDLLPGLVAVDTTQTTSVVVPVIRRTTLEQVGMTLTDTVLFDSTKAQVVLRFVDQDGRPVPDIAVSVTGAQNVAYDAGGTYDDTSGATGARGLAFLLNVDASATPAAKVVLLSAAVSAELPVWVQSGAVTALELLVSTK